jgi:predicted dehydrogenase
MSRPSKSKLPIRVGVIGTGRMAEVHARAFQKLSGVRITSACDVDAARVEDFAARMDIPNTFLSSDDLIASGEVDAVSVVTPDALHGPISLQAVSAGLHVLCEKPLALNYAEAKQMAAAAGKAGVINMVNFSYRRSAALQKARQMIDSGTLGEVRHLEASYLQSWLPSKVWGDWKSSPAWLWRLSSKHGSKGVLGDIRVHLLDFATYPAGPLRSLQATLKTFPKAPGNRMGPYRLDANDSAVITAELECGGLAVIHATRWATGKKNALFLRIHGSKGAVEIDLDHDFDTLSVCAGKDIHTASWKEIRCRPFPDIYELFIRGIRSGKQEQPDFARGAEIQKLLDASFASSRLGKSIRV